MAKPQTRTDLPPLSPPAPGFSDAPLETPTDTPQAPTIPHIVATFEGTYYKGVPGAMEVISFREQVKIPNTWIPREDLSPVFIFKEKFVGRVIKGNSKYNGFSGIRTVYLTHTSDLPDNLSPDQQLLWTADYQSMVKLASRFGKSRFVALDPKEGTPLPPQTVEVKPEFYTEVAALRNAIKRCMTEPQAFKAEQDKLSSGYERKRDELTMQEELAALGY